MEFRNELDAEAYRFLLTGGVSLKDQYPDHPSLKLKDVDTQWVSMKCWGEVSRLSDMKNFPRLYEQFYNPQVFSDLKHIYDSLTP